MTRRQLIAADLAWYNPVSRIYILNLLLRCLISPGFLAVLLIRVQQGVHRYSPGVAVLIRSVNHFLTGIESHVIEPIGPGLHIPHPSGVTLSSQLVIGSRVTLFGHTSVGNKTLNSREPDHPVLKDDCMIGVGACVLGNVTIGKGAKVGANAVVMQDVADGAVYVGFPNQQR